MVYFGVTIAVYRFQIFQLASIFITVLLFVPFLVLVLPVVMLINWFVDIFDDANEEERKRNKRDRRHRNYLSQELDSRDSSTRHPDPRRDISNGHDQGYRRIIYGQEEIRRPKLTTIKISKSSAINFLFKKWRRGKSIIPYILDTL